MGTTDVRIDPELNKEIWAHRIKSVPHRLRRNDEENTKEKLYTYTSYISVPSFKGLQTVVINAE
ncbi:hypothetical protein C8R45DRAFT_1115183 [Mycena sanguinolenta]|nr:hypothetical protein C8R45DRAFT_1115183 [Mycena sanguinolenta]